MKKAYYDLHIHSCLSPCADSEMTPNNIAGMAYLSGINIIALTDHNTTLNCPAFFEAARKYSLVPIAGMELTSAEDIHLLCLFPNLETALDFEKIIAPRRMKVKNNATIYNEQRIMDGNDNITAIVPELLSAATDITIEEAFDMLNAHGGICMPAHIDREANGLISVLGDIPKHIAFTCFEFNEAKNVDEYKGKYPLLKGKKTLVASDAHTLGRIRDKDAYFLLPDGLNSDEDIICEIFSQLKG